MTRCMYFLGVAPAIDIRTRPTSGGDSLDMVVVAKVPRLTTPLETQAA